MCTAPREVHGLRRMNVRMAVRRRHRRREERTAQQGFWSECRSVSVCPESSPGQLVGAFDLPPASQQANGGDEDAGGDGWMLGVRPLEILSLSQVGL